MNIYKGVVQRAQLQLARFQVWIVFLFLTVTVGFFFSFVGKVMSNCNEFFFVLLPVVV